MFINGIEHRVGTPIADVTRPGIYPAEEDNYPVCVYSPPRQARSIGWCYGIRETVEIYDPNYRVLAYPEDSRG